jgi:acetyl-CoA acetyltransferase
LTGRVALVGAGQTRFGSLDASPRTLLREALGEALASVEAGLRPAEVDEGILATLGFSGWQIGNPAAILSEELGHPGMPVLRVENACASGGGGVRSAWLALRSDAEGLVLVAGLEKMTDASSLRRRYWLGVSGETEYERLSGLTFPGVYALMAERYLRERGLGKEVLGAVAVKNHANGVLNPKAHLRKPLRLEDHAHAPRVAEPLGLYDCCPVSDGAAVVLLAGEERARKLTRDPVWISSVGAASDTLALADRASLTSLGASVRAGREAFRKASTKPSEVQVAELHDCFTIAELLALEDLGLVPPGEAPRRTLEGRTALHSELPVNPSGGLKSKGHPLGATGVGQLVELFHQLRGECGERQVEGAERGLAHNVGGSGATCTVTLLEV